MDGDIAPLDKIVQLSREHDAAVMVDDSHATGFIGPTGRGSAEHHGVQSEIDIFTSTLGKALGGGTGGFTSAKRPVIDLLRQRSRPYLFSTITPVAAAGIKGRVCRGRRAATAPPGQRRHSASRSPPRRLHLKPALARSAGPAARGRLGEDGRGSRTRIYASDPYRGAKARPAPCRVRSPRTRP